jgi:hypothetical protein
METLLLLSIRFPTTNSYNTYNYMFRNKYNTNIHQSMQVNYLNIEVTIIGGGRAISLVVVPQSMF